jgi:NADH-quinone oxidoreductase subunit G
MSKEITLTIDQIQVTAPAGTLIVDAAKKAGIDIPVFCYHPKMEPVGMCRMCLVEIGRPSIDRATNQPVLNEDGSVKLQFGPKLETACTTPISEGMVVITASEKVKAARKDVLELLLTSHPLDCPVCDKGGECPLQNLTMRFGPATSRFEYSEKNHAAKHVPLGELIYLDRERCIQCGRCVRFQTDLADDPVIGFYNRGRSLEIATSSEPGFDSIFSGNTTDICPVGALTTADFHFGARPWELKSAASICTHCPVGCNLVYNTRREAKSDGQVVIKRAMPRQNEAVNEMWICDKGRFGYHFAESKERLMQPLIRRDGELQPATWEEALQIVSEKIRAFSFNFNVLAGGRLANEDLYALRELASTLNGQSYLYSRMAGGDLVSQVGLDSQTDLGKAGRGTTFVVVASNLREEAPLYWLRVKNAVKRGAKLVVVNARDTRLDKIAHYTIRYPYGREAEAVLSLLPEAPHGDEINRLLAESDHLVVIYGSDGTGLQTSSALATACATLLVKTGHAGKPDSGLLAVWPHANDQGAWELGFRPAEDMDALLAHTGVLYIAGADPAGDCPDCSGALAKSNFLIVQDLFLTETARLAQVVLPAQSQLERDGSYTNAERRVQRFQPVIPALPGTLPDYEITNRIRQQALRMSLDPVPASQVFLALAVHVPSYQGLSYPRLAETAEQWPLVGRSDVYYGGTGYNNTQGLGIKLPTLAERGGRLDIPEPFAAVPSHDADVLVGVPVTLLYDHGRTLTPTELLKDRLPRPFIVLHPDTAAAFNLAAGETTRLRVKGKILAALVQIDSSLPAGVALVPRSLEIPVLEPQPVEIIR